MDISGEKKRVAKKKISKGIYPLIDNLNLDNSVKEKAYEIYKTLNVGNRKGVKRAKIACYCVYTAHLELGMNNINSYEIGNALGLTKQETKSALNANYRNISNEIYNDDDDELGYNQLIRNYLKNECDFDNEIINSFIESFNNLLKRDPKFKTKQPNTLIAGYLYYQMPLFGYNIDNKSLCNDFALSITTIKNTAAEITKRL